MFERDDWVLFRNLGTLSQKAGVPVRNLAALVLKELTDNALDTGAQVKVGEEEGGWFYIEDNGPGMPGDGAQIANLFSIKRPLTSSKLLRRPSRGALGNGLRVVAGTVLASGGQLQVETGGYVYAIEPRIDGESDFHVLAQSTRAGTRIRICFGPSLDIGEAPLRYCTLAVTMSGMGKMYAGKTSPWWYDSDSFYELFQAARGKSCAEVLSNFKGCTKAMAEKVFAPERMACDIGKDESNNALLALRAAIPAPSVSSIGKMGPIGDSFSHAIETGTVSLGNGIEAEMPVCVEAFVSVCDDDDESDAVTVLVNRTPVTGQINTQRQKAHQIGIIGCGLKHLFDVGRKKVNVFLSVTIPYMPVTTDGKEPDLYVILGPIARVIESAAKKAKRKTAKAAGPAVTQRDVISSNLYAGMDKASGDGKYRYSLRQLFYAIRPFMLEQLGKEPDYNYFAQVITDIEAETGSDLPGLYRDARGVIYHPHTGEEIPLGTLNVEKYKRPDWTFNKILYSEKEGLFSILKDANWPERNDCALLTSKGFASRAARDVLDMISESQEDIYFFCIHDADASGTLIYQALTEATRARGARKVHVINLGLEPWEALDMGLQVETFREHGATATRKLPTANYVDTRWANWLQTKRVELNAMTSPQFLDWLDSKFQEYTPKVVPPREVLAAKLDTHLQASVESLLAERILKEAGFSEQVKAIMARATKEGSSLDLLALVDKGLAANPEHQWSSPLADAAEDLARKTLE